MFCGKPCIRALDGLKCLRDRHPLQEAFVMFKRVRVFAACLTVIGAAMALAPTDVSSYRPVPNWLRLPDTMKLGQVTAVATNAADQVFVFHRGRSPIIVLDAEGKYLRSWGDGLIENAH